jgi:hypothetical protein
MDTVTARQAVGAYVERGSPGARARDPDPSPLGFFFFLFFYLINRGGHRTASQNGHINRDLCSEAVGKTASVKHFSPPR